MSISFNHPKNTVTSTGTLNLTVSGGNPTSPQPIRFNSTSIVMPVRALPAGEAGAMVFDSGSRTMKYHDGTSWVSILGQDVILAPIYQAITLINQQLAGKVDSVSYISGLVPQASISGTQLNITFPLSSGGGTGANGLFTSSKQGSVQMYALSSGMNATNIREQMSGVSGGQNGRNGTQASPFITNDGWCFSDGMWWTWQGQSGTVTQLVPNLNQQAYLKPMDVSGITQTSSVIASSGSIGGTSLTIDQLPPHSFSFSGQTSVAGDHVHNLKYNPMGWQGSSNVKDGTGRYAGDGVHVTESAGSHIHTFTGTSNTLGSGNQHSHSLNSVDVAHFNLAVLFNIATPSYALNEAAANNKYVLKAGDVMTGALTIAGSASVKGDDTNLTITLRDNANAERAMIFHNSSNNTLRLRSSGGSEISINNAGNLTATSLTASTLSISSTASTGALTVTGPLNVTGQITATADIWAFSDIRLKENIKPIENALDIVDSISGVTGNFIGDERVRSMVLAQEVQKSFPTVVTEDENGYLKVNYDGLIPLLLNAVSDLRKEVNELRGNK